MLLENTVGNAKRTIGSLPVERAVRIVHVIQLVRSKTSMAIDGNLKII